MWKPLPIGVDNFKNLITNDYYYVDKTLFIKELIDKKGEVNLFTRPRRFGKTLNLSMLRYFFEINENSHDELFQNTKIMSCGEKYLAHMGQYPVISLSLKGLKQGTFQDAFHRFKEEISREYKNHDEVLENLKYDADRELFLRIIDKTAAYEEYLASIQFLSECLYQCYKKKVIILIDEYDVPLENSYFSGFYDKMIALIRSIFESALKTNPYLEFAVITGCLRISKESIFTGLNNLKIMSITSGNYAEYFGFTQNEIDEILQYYKLEADKETVRQWYDGYLFGNQAVYNPWSVINYVSDNVTDAKVLPTPYWSNTSANSIVRRLVERADFSVKQEIESLIEGNTITKPVHEDITYDEMESTQDNLWNFLYFTGYLKKISEYQHENDEIRYVKLAIPNREVRYIYKRTILSWFDEKIQSTNLSELYHAMLEGDVQTMEDKICENLMETISFYDYKEDYYHGFLAGLMKNIKNYIVISNRESGLGRPDILIRYPSVRGKAVIIEIKIADSFQQLEAGCDDALNQIETQKYEYNLRSEGYKTILKYGVAFWKKDCMVKRQV